MKSKLFCWLASIIACLFSQPCFAYSFEVAGIYYNIEESNTVSVSGCASNLYILKIPNVVSYNGLDYKVTNVAEKAFLKQKSIVEVTIPANVTKIKSYAFAGCTGIRSITFEDSVNPLIIQNGSVFSDGTLDSSNSPFYYSNILEAYIGRDVQSYGLFSRSKLDRATFGGYWWLPKIKDFPIVFYTENQLLTKSCPKVESSRGTKMGQNLLKTYLAIFFHDVHVIKDLCYSFAKVHNYCETNEGNPLNLSFAVHFSSICTDNGIFG